MESRIWFGSPPCVPACWASARASAEPWWCRMVVMSAERIARRGGVVRIAVAARHLRKSGPLQAMLDAVDLAMLQGCTPMVYRWRADAAVLDAA